MGRKDAMQDFSKKLTRSALFAYSLPAAPIAAMGLPLVVYLPHFYAGYMGFGLAAIGQIFLIIRLWDVFVDPVLGLVSDKFPTRWGRRRHWIVLSVPIMLASTWAIFLPEKGVGSTYLIVWMLVLYVGWSLLTLSHVAWGAELSDDYHERSSIQSWRQAVLVAGLVLVLIMPALAQRFHPAELEPAQIASMGWFVIVTLPLAVAWAVLRLPERPVPPRPHLALGKAFGVLLKNHALQILLSADLISGISSGIVASLFLFLAQDVLQLDKTWSSVLLLVYFTSGIVFVAPILRISRRLGKHRAAVASALWSTCLLPSIWFLPPGMPYLTLGLFVLLGANYAAGPFLYQSMMADVADHDTVETGQARTGLFFSLLTMTNKLGQALAIWIAFSLLDWVGFDPKLENTAAALTGFRLVYILPSVSIALGTALLLWFFPLDEARQRVNRETLERRALDALATAVEVKTGEPRAMSAD
jgi:glycoside/pentoside/hexuronide:cation symporter, GPH family